MLGLRSQGRRKSRWWEWREHSGLIQWSGGKNSSSSKSPRLHSHCCSNLITQNAESISAAHAGIVRPADVLGMNGQFHT